MTLAALFAPPHADDSRLELVYFWAAVLLALTPVLIFGGIGVVLLKNIWKQRRDTPPPPEPAPLDASERPSA